MNEFVSSLYFKDNNIEREADVFASELLLPSEGLNYDVKNLQSIISVADKYQVSIQAAAIKLVEKSDNHICFICCKDDKIKWYVESNNLRENLKLKDIRNVRIPENSLFNTHKNDLKYSYRNKGKVSACVWLDEVELSDFVYEEFLYSIDYNSVYIMIDAEPLFKYEY